VLAVVVDGRWSQVPPDGASGGAQAVDYLEPAGIYREVSLRITPQIFISDVFAKPVNVLSSSPTIDVQVTISASHTPSGLVTVTAALVDGSTKLATAGATAAVTGPGDTVTTLTISGLPDVARWSPDNPKLYQVSATIQADGVAHTVEVNTGFREATFEDGGFYLNGERLEIFGLNRHQLFPYTGMAAPERLQRRDAELLKDELNCNMVRCSHYPQSPHFLDACDELGLMVWEEPPGWQYVGQAAFQSIVVQNVHDMMVRDRNRPSVIVWATRLNETANEPGLYTQTRQLAYTLDGSRQTTGAMSFQNTTSGWAEDVYSYDDYHSSNGNAVLEPPIPGVPYMVSEAVGALDGAPLYRWVDTDATLAIQARMHAQVHNIAQSNVAYAGLLAWAGIDYASLNGGNRIWHNVKWPGVLDTFRVPKPGAAFYRAQVDPSVSPVIAPVFFWDFGPSSPSNGPGEGVMIATNCDRLELYVNGAHFTTGTPDTTNYASVAYPPVFVNLTVSGSGSPELRIDGYVGSQLVTSLKMSSDTTTDQLALALEDASIQGDGTDATRFTFRSADAYGNQRPYSSGDVTLALSGPATLIADNPFPFAAFGGVGGAFIRSQPGTSGTVTVIATHPTLGQAVGQLTVEAASDGAGSPGVSAPTVVGVATGAISTPEGPSTPGPSATPPPSSKSPPGAPGVSKASVRAALAAILRPRGRQGRIPQLLTNGGYIVRFKAPSAGRLAIDWYYLPHGEHDATGKKPGRILVATTTDRLRKAGAVPVKVKLTPRGRSLLRHARHERLTAQASFTPTGQPAVRVSRVISLSR
jgi:beta-galactosidase